MKPVGKKRVVVVGGGTGTHTVLRGLRQYADQLELTAIVSMADSGGSTGRLRDEFGQLPVGDVRNALTALAADGDAHDALLRQLFEYRFDRGGGLTGHNFGNLLLTALTSILGSEAAAIAAAGQILRVHGRVIPVTTDNVQLRAEYDDEVIIVGEAEIDEPTSCRYDRRISTLSLTPTAQIYTEAAEALRTADVVILGPGDLYTSVLANCVVDGFADALAQSAATVVYVCNLMSKRGQTTDYTIADHVSEVTRYTRRAPDVVVAHRGTFPASLLERYAAEGEFPVGDTQPLDVPVHAVMLVAEEEVVLPGGDRIRRSLIRHDSDRLAHALLHVANITIPSL